MYVNELHLRKLSHFISFSMFKVERHTQYGYVRGTSYHVTAQDSFYPKYISVFLGIPYARPPRKLTSVY